jgi:hypothetical protein
MRYAAYVLVVALAALTATAAQAQTQEERPGNPAARLLAQRTELSLTADQVRRLEEIDRRTTQQAQELRTQLEALRGVPMGEPFRMRDMTAEQRERLVANRGEMEPLMAQLRAIHAQGMADARSVLTVEQSDRARAMMYGGPGRGAGWGPAGGPGMRRGMGRGPDFMPGAAFGPRADWRGVNRFRAAPGFRAPWMSHPSAGWRGRGPGW